MAAPIVTLQPAPKVVPQITAWTTGLCHCCQDMKSCCFAFWCCPCFACTTTSKFGESLCLPLVDIFGPGLMASFGLAVCVPPVTLSMRVAVRHRYQIMGSLCEDILVSCFCICCSWCQMNREIKHREDAPMILTTQTTVPIVTTVQPTAIAVSAL